MELLKCSNWEFHFKYFFRDPESEILLLIIAKPNFSILQFLDERKENNEPISQLAYVPIKIRTWS